MSLRGILLYFIPLMGLNLLGQDKPTSPSSHTSPVVIEVQTSEEVPERVVERDGDVIDDKNDRDGEDGRVDIDNKDVVVIEALSDSILDKHTGYKDGHQWVDLGLPSGTKWATLNVGAKDVKDYGDYFSWGEIMTKKVYNEETSLTSGLHLRRIWGKPRYDAVTHYWGKNWCLPTEEQIVELVTYTDAKEIKVNKDTNLGVLLTSMINGASIFFPSGGMKGDDMTYAVGDMGFFWSGSEFSTVWEKGCFLMISPYGARLSEELRCVGANVRGVTK